MPKVYTFFLDSNFFRVLKITQETGDTASLRTTETIIGLKNFWQWYSSTCQIETGRPDFAVCIVYFFAADRCLLPTAADRSYGLDGENNFFV